MMMLFFKQLTQLNRILLSRNVKSSLSVLTTGGGFSRLNTAAIATSKKGGVKNEKNKRVNKIERQSSGGGGGNEQQSELRRLINSTLFISYEDELAWRRQQARHSILFLFKEWTPAQMDQFLDDCIGTASRVKEIYLLCKRREPQRRLVLVEFETRACVDNLLTHYASHFSEAQCNSGYTHTRVLFYANSMNRNKNNFFSRFETFNAIKNSVSEFVDNEDFEKMVIGGNGRFGFMTQRFESSFSSSSTADPDATIEHFYDVLKIDEMSYRLRYFLASLIEESLTSMFKHCMCLPFGSSVNRLGRRNTDLDLGLWLNRLELGESGEELNYLEQQQSRGISDSGAQSPTRMFGRFKLLDNISYSSSRDEMRQHSQRKITLKHLDLLEWVLKYALPRTKVYDVIRGARVPIIKFDFEPIDSIKLNCDLSMNSLESSFLMSKLFWIYTSLDTRIPPLVFLIRTWAKLAGITCDRRPSRNFTNFQLTCLAFNYLLRLSQPLIVSLDQLTYKPIKEQSSSFSGAENNNRMFLSVCSNIEKIRQLINKSGGGGVNRDSLSDLLAGFFDYYAMFDFGRHAVSLNTELSERLSLPHNTTRDAVFIENPINDALNACTNVDQAHLDHFVASCVKTAKIIDAQQRNKFDLIEFLEKTRSQIDVGNPVKLSINDEMNVK